MNKSWHTIPLEKIFSDLESQKTGLENSEVLTRLKKFGQNKLPSEKSYSRLKLFLNQFNSSLMYILLTTVVISFFLKHYSDTIFISIVLLINTTVGFYQENKANQSLLALKKIVKIKTKVLRNGQEKEIDSEELVIGDIVFLRAGDKVPADGRIIESKNLKINESNLTGEWLATEKGSVEILPKKTPLSEQTNLVFMSTSVEEGRATMVVVATGIDTQIGKIVSLLKETKERRTPLQNKIASLSRITGIFILLVISIIIIFGYLTGKPFADIFVTALALAVSAIPEGLLPAITVILVLGMRRIFKQNGLVRKLSATETLGSVTVICTDKTGTLTEGKMQISQILTSTKELMRAEIKKLAKDEIVNGVESHISALKIATLTNEAFVENPADTLKEWIIRGKPTERALLLAGMHAGLDKQKLEKQYPILDRINFESENKFAATFHRYNKTQNILYVIGAPEEIIARSINLDVNGQTEKLGTAQADKLITKLESLTQKGLRVVACAHKNYTVNKKYQDLNELVKDLSLVGFIAIKDPLRPETKESILTTQRAGIRTVIITGDHKYTAQTIAEEIGLKAKKENILEGQDLEKISDKELQIKAKTVSIYARVSPHHKLRIVNALQANGEVVAMIGDGVNDAPALKSADIGISVGSGTDVAKEVSDLILLDDNFKTVVKAIEQGRVVFTNIRKVFTYLLADDFSELFLFLGSMTMGFPLPLLPVQILWINIVEDGLPDIALTTEQETAGVMDKKPRDPNEQILNRPLKLWMLTIFFITGLTAFLSFFFLWKLSGDIAHTRTFVFALMCIDSIIFAFSVRSFDRTIFRKDIFSNYYLVGAAIISTFLLLIAIYLPLAQKFLMTQSLSFLEWAVIISLSFLEILLIEFSKKQFFGKRTILLNLPRTIAFTRK